MANYIDLPVIGGNSSWKDPVASSGSLPLAGNSVGDVRLAELQNVIYSWSGSGWTPISGGSGGGGSGTVTSVALSLPTSVFDVSGSPITTNGTITATFDNQNPNTFFAGPTVGAATTPAFRMAVPADIPTSIALSLPNIFSVSGSPVGTTGTLTASLVPQLQNLVFASPSGSSGTPSFRALVGSDQAAANLASTGNGGVTGTLPGANQAAANLASTGNGGVTGTLPGANITPINLASGANGGVTGTLPGTNYAAANLASTGNGGVTGTLPSANITPINLASGSNGGVTGTLPGTNYAAANLASTGNGGVTGTLPGANQAAANLASTGNGGVTGSVLAASVPAINLASTAGLNGGVTGTLPIGAGGSGQTTANAALNAFLPSQTGNAGFVLRTNGTNTSWASTAFTTVPNSEIRLYGSSSYGSVNTVIPLFITVVKNTGTDITYNQNASSGAWFRINTPGIYAMGQQMESPTGDTQHIGFSLNSTELTTAIYDVNSLARLNWGSVPVVAGTTSSPSVSWTGALSLNDVVRPHNSGKVPNGANYATFYIVRLS